MVSEEASSFENAVFIIAAFQSYGGFVTAHIAVRDHGSTFQCAVCIAPVVDFRFYGLFHIPDFFFLPPVCLNGNGRNYVFIVNVRCFHDSKFCGF